MLYSSVFIFAGHFLSSGSCLGGQEASCVGDGGGGTPQGRGSPHQGRNPGSGIPLLNPSCSYTITVLLSMTLYLCFVAVDQCLTFELLCFRSFTQECATQMPTCWMDLTLRGFSPSLWATKEGAWWRVWEKGSPLYNQVYKLFTCTTRYISSPPLNN